MARTFLILALFLSGSLALSAASAFAAEPAPPPGAGAAAIPASNVAGKKLIRVAQEILDRLQPCDVPGKVDAWQQTGYDGACFCLWADEKANGKRVRMAWRWWDVDPRKREEFDADVRALKSVKNWGRLTDNFLWMASHAEGHKPPDWFSDADWAVVLANAKLGASIVKELGFKGIAFDAEGYGGGAYGVWRQPWDYPLYARSDYQIEKRKAPRPFPEVAAKVRQRGRQWAAAISGACPGLTLAVLPGLYDATWVTVAGPRCGGDPAQSAMGLWSAFVDGLLEGLDEASPIVAFSEATYIMSQYRDMAAERDVALRQSLVASGVPELARKRLTFAAGIWTDAGAGLPRFSATDARHNHREPDRHKHAVHNSLAVSDHYAWQWGEWGSAGESNFMTTDPTPLMRQYWQANLDGHRPLPLDWRPRPHHDHADYAAAESKAAAAEAALWKKMEQDGYTVAVQLPVNWKFDFDPEMLVRYRNYFSTDYDDGTWFEIACTRCWQSQGYKANETGTYRAWFDAPASLDPQKQQILLVFGGLGSGEGHVYFNERWISYAMTVVDVTKTIKPGRRNLVGLMFLNKGGPGGLMGRVQVLARSRQKSR